VGSNRRLKNARIRICALQASSYKFAARHTRLTATSTEQQMGLLAADTGTTILTAISAATQLEGTRLAFNLSFTVVLLDETTVATTIAVEVLGAVNELCDTVKRDARIPCTYRAFSTTRNHIVAGLAACFRHVETLVALASASVSVRLLIGCTDSTNASAALDRQKIRSTHRADIGRSALLAAAHDRAATLTLALIQVVPRQTLSAASPIRALARHASLDHLA